MVLNIDANIENADWTKKNKKEEKMPEVTITKEEIQEYEDCRKSGITNMFMIKNVEMVTGLNRKQIIYIMTDNHYSDLMKLHGIKRG